jgi:hypothetical protein
MIKTIKNKKYNKNKKTRRKTNKKSEFKEAILKEWKIQTRGCYEKDKTTIYKGDYYLSFNTKCDYNNHIHLILKNTSNIIYVLKKMDKNNNIIHSSEFKISLLSDPKKIVRSMISNYKDFSKP